MMTSKVRLIVLLVTLVPFVYALWERTYEAAALIALGMGYLIWSHYREGTVFLATQAFQDKDYEKTKRLLDEIKNPERLRKKRRNYYEFMSGNLALKAQDYPAAERHFQIASRLPFRRPNDKAIILINLANINLRKQDYERVKAYVALARKLEVTSRVAQIINKIENEIPKNQR